MRLGLTPILAALGLAAACGSDSAGDGDGPWKTKLADHARGILVRAPAPEPKPAVLEEDFTAGAASWNACSNPVRPFEHDPDVLRVSARDGTVELSGTRGFLFRVIEVEPSTCYRFRARLQARAIEATDPFFGATTWLSELSRRGTPEELVGADPDAFLVERHLFETTLETADWTTRERLFVTSPETRSLSIALVLSFDTDVTSGSVAFDDIVLEPLPLAAHWESELAIERQDFARGLPDLEGWRAERLVRGLLGAEVRPSIVCLPGERVGFQVRVPAGEPCLELGLGFWSTALLPGQGREQRFRVALDGEDLLDEGLHAPDDPSDGRWRDVRIDLADHAGEEVTLELGVEGDLPGLFGAPILRDAAHADERKNVILLSIDTLRADYVGSYGAPGNPTPHLDALAAEGVRFARVDGQAPYTLPGHTTLFSGQFPSVHGVQRTTHVISTGRSPLLPLILSNEGYRTQAFTGGGFVNADFGFDRGFDGFANIDPLRHREARFFEQIIQSDHGALRRLRRRNALPQRVTRELVDEHGPQRIHAWLGERAREDNEPFFLFVHTFAVHDYDPPAEYLTCHEELGCTSNRIDYEEYRLTRANGWTVRPISDADREHVGHLYAATLRFVDDLVGDLLAELERLDLADDTIFAVVTDHGEELFERGFRQHGKTLYEELTALPMILRIPGVAPRVYTEPAMQVDLAPILLGALGLERDPRMQGTDLLARGAEGSTWSEIRDDFVHKVALRDDGWKLIHAPPDDTVSFPAEHEWQLFYLPDDPNEEHDLKAEQPERFEAMKRDLLERKESLETYGESLGATETKTLDDETRRRLRELGYVDE